MNKLRDVTVNVAEDAIKLGSELVVSTITAAATGDPSLAKNASSATDILLNAVESKAKQKLQAHLEAERNIEHYRSALEQLLAQSKKSQRIVFFIDELDRCRPDFSMQVIEKVKHLFSVRNVVFVLVINKEQLLNTVMHSYGVNSAGAGTYLQKFIHIETRLPSIQRAYKLSSKQINSYIDSLLEAHEIDSGVLDFERGIFVDLIGGQLLDLNPREIERVFTIASTVLLMEEYQSGRPWFYFFVFVSAAVKVSDPDFFYKKYKSGRFFSSTATGHSRIEERFFTLGKKELSGFCSNQASNIVYYQVIEDVCDLIEMLVE